ncbi:hypothetical protein JCM6882_001898 [Rhodosporidiobolus microsporus]
MLSQEVLKNYRTAGRITSEVCAFVADRARNGDVTAAELCAAGDQRAFELLKREGKRGGIAHPVSLGVNEIVCNFAPLLTDADTGLIRLKEGDLAKVQIGLHVEGFGVVLGETIAVSERAKQTTSDQADLILAAHQLADLALKVVRPGITNRQVATILQRFLRVEFNGRFEGVVGLAAHSHAEGDIQGPKTINLFPTPEQATDAAETCVLEEGEVYAVEVWVTDAKDGNPIASKTLPTTLYNDARRPWPTGDVDLERVQKVIQEKARTFPCTIPQQGARVSQSVVTFAITVNGTERLSPSFPPSGFVDTLQPGAAISEEVLSKYC